MKDIITWDIENDVTGGNVTPPRSKDKPLF
jgi:hypothetical protein